MLRQTFLSYDPCVVRPVAHAALQAIEKDMPPLHLSVRSVLKDAVQSDVIWQMRMVILLAINLTDTFPSQVMHSSPGEEKVLREFMTLLQVRQWDHLRGTPDPRVKGGYARYNSQEEFCEDMVRWYVKY